MKMIQCIIQPYKLDEVVAALLNVATGMTVSDAKGHGHQKGQPMLYRGHEYEVFLVPKAMIEIVVDDDRVGDIVKIVRDVARTGQIGDGRIFILPVDACYHVRSGFMDIG